MPWTNQNARMTSRVAIAVAVALFAFHCAGIAAISNPADAAPQIKKTARNTTVAALTRLETTPSREEAAANAASLELYKRQLAQKISDADSAKVHAEQPQALLRSVVVLRFVVNKNGKLISSAIQRSNRDPVTERTALASLRNAAPFPRPPAKLLKKGRLVLLETWLFNRDGRYQMRSIAQAQKSE